MGTSASFARKIFACLVAALLSLALVPFAHAEGTSEADTETVASGSPDQSNASADPSLGESQEVSAEQDAEGSPVAPMLASGLVGKPNSFINSDVTLDSEPVIGSFTVEGLTYAVIDESHVELVGVSEADAGTLMLPESVAYADSEYTLSSIAPYAFYLSGVTGVELPASVSDVDDRAFRSSDVANVTVAEDNQTYSSFDGALYSADKTRLLLIPEGRVGAVLLPREAEVADPGKFSHCSLVDAISVEDGAAFASENGLLYTSDLTTLLRVPVGATEVTIREGCTTIAAGALEACAKLATINAPASVASISPDVFHAIPTVSLPAASLTESAPQLTAMVALSTTDDDLPESNPSAIAVGLPAGADGSLWEATGFTVVVLDSQNASNETESAIDTQTASSYYSWSTAYARSSVDCEWWERRTATPYDPSATPGIHVSTTYNGYWYREALHRTNRWEKTQYGWRLWLYNSTSTQYFCFFRHYGEWCSAVSSTPTGTPITGTTDVSGPMYLHFNTVARWNVNGGYWAKDDGSYDTESQKIDTRFGDYDQPHTVSGPEGATPQKEGHVFVGWSTSKDADFDSSAVMKSVTLSTSTTYYAIWRPDYHISFDTSSEPKDEEYIGETKPEEVITGTEVNAGEKVEISNPSRPGYVFQGWTIPNADGEHALDQDLVYSEGEGDDKKWYVDASKLPDYYEQLKNEEGKIELTARWTSVISVDVPSSATFYYDLVTDQSAEAHEAALSGTTSFSSKSQVDLRICGLESKKAAGADSLFSSGADSALLSVYPAPNDKAQTMEGAQQGPAGAKPATAVDFSLDDVVLERAFTKEDADAYKIPAGDGLTLAYRLNLSDAAKLDYDKILAMAEDDEASLASLTYTFTANADLYCFWTLDDDGTKRTVAEIKADAEKIAAGDTVTADKYTAWMNADHRFYVKWYDQGMYELEGGLAQGKYSTYEARIIGLNHDDKSDGSGKAGITFQLVGLLKANYRMGQSGVGSNWMRSEARANMNPDHLTEGVSVDGTDTNAVWAQVPFMLQNSIETVRKRSTSTMANYNAGVIATDDRLFSLSVPEVYTHASYAPYTQLFTTTAREGNTYDYYQQFGYCACVSMGNVNHGSIANGDGSQWLRTVSNSNNNRYETVIKNGSTWDRPAYSSISNESSSALQVYGRHSLSPAFCL